MARKRFIAGNWKMNKTPSEAVALIRQLLPSIDNSNVDVVFCVPSIDIIPAVEATKDSSVSIGAQNFYFQENGAYAGEISPEMLEDAGVKYTIIGHSERREHFKETDDNVNKKVLKAFEHGIIPIICCGETLCQRKQKVYIDWIRMQIKIALQNVTPEQAKAAIIAYEPIWAIGPGKIPPDKDYITMIGTYIKEITDGCDVVYGGGLKVDNAEMLASVPVMDGGLIALTRFQGEIGFYPEEYLEIIKTYMGH